MRRYLLACLVVFGAGTARAIPDPGADLLLGQILSENLKQTYDLGAMLEGIKDVTGYVRDTANATVDAVTAVRTGYTIIKDPVTFLRNASASWVNAFPELQDILVDHYTVQQDAYLLAHPELLPTYDLGAHVRLLERAHGQALQRYEATMRAEDPWHIAEDNDKINRDLMLNEQGKEALATLKDLSEGLRGAGVNPQQAAGYTALATSVSTVANILAAQTMLKLARDQAIRTGAQYESDKSQRASLLKQHASAIDGMSSWRMDLGEKPAQRPASRP